MLDFCCVLLLSQQQNKHIAMMK